MFLRCSPGSLPFLLSALLFVLGPISIALSRARPRSLLPGHISREIRGYVSQCCELENKALNREINNASGRVSFAPGTKGFAQRVLPEEHSYSLHRAHFLSESGCALGTLGDKFHLSPTLKSLFEKPLSPGQHATTHGSRYDCRLTPVAICSNIQQQWLSILSL